MTKEKLFYNVLSVLTHVSFFWIIQRFDIEHTYLTYWVGALSGMIMTCLIKEANKQ